MPSPHPAGAAKGSVSRSVLIEETVKDFRGFGLHAGQNELVHHEGEASLECPRSLGYDLAGTLA